MERNGALRFMMFSTSQTGTSLAEQFQFRAVEACTQAASSACPFDDSQFYHRRGANFYDPAGAQTYPCS